MHFDSALWNEIPAMIARAGRQIPQVRCCADSRRGQGLLRRRRHQGDAGSIHERIVELNRGNYLTFKAVRSCEVPVVTAVHGFVIGGGIGICGASDVIIASDDAYFSLPEIDRGAMGGAAHLVAHVAAAQGARFVLHRWQRSAAAEAHRLGGVEKVVRARTVARRKHARLRM